MRRFALWFSDLVALTLVLMTAISLLWMAVVYFNPYSLWNPYPPIAPTPLSGSIAPTATPTRMVFATSVAQGALLVQASPTAPADLPLVPTSATPFVVPTLIPTLAPTPLPIVPLVYQMRGQPIYSPNFGNGQGCNWQGIAGAVLNENGDAVNGLIVALERNGTLVSQAETGSAKTYAPQGGGYELLVGAQPVDSNEYSVRLYKSGEPVSPSFPLALKGNCEENLLLVNFQPELNP